MKFALSNKDNNCQEKLQKLSKFLQVCKTVKLKMASRRRSVMPLRKPEAPAPSATSRRMSVQVMRPPVPTVKPPTRVADLKPKPKVGRPKLVAGKLISSKKVEEVDEFVSGENFDFQIAPSPMGPMTRQVLNLFCSF